MDDAHLVERCRLGDEFAWESLVRRHQNRVFAMALHYLRDREDARDAAQEVFIKIYQGFGSLDRDRAFLPWMLRLARNCCIDRIRRRKVRTPDVAIPVDEFHDLASEGPSPEDDSLLKGRRALLYQALGRISPKYREMILLKEIQELEMQEVADILDLPMGTVKSRSNRARLELARVVRDLDEPTADSRGAQHAMS
ncbi:MAG: sigma-70 family RNA polymerase sigma factor [Thermoanaerobaculia bacterium]|nr:sigma-70 family RNA polymerase sigma factor [Thermoanaerobaculia bacterium]